MGATVTDPLIGTIVDERYKVVSRIARGGMATVYLAIDRRLDREVALKVMHAHLADGASGATFVSRFRREARSAARLTHPGLVGVLDQGVDGETSYLVMEYIDGPTLRHRLLSDGAVELGMALTYASEILDALAAAHRAGLVHRDIKPENVLITKDGHVKVADFGLARAVTEVTSTTTGTVMGTVGYLAPELVSRGISDARTDVYSVGVMLYEMVTGHQPFTGDTPIQVALQHVTTDLPAPSEREPWLPIEVDELVSALAARDPQHRPGDGAAAHSLVLRTVASLDPEVLVRRSEAEPATPVQFTSTVTSGPLLTGEAATEVYDQLADPADKVEVDSSAAATTRLERPAGSTVALPIGVGVELAEAGEPPAGTVVPAAQPSRPRRRRWLLAALWVVIAGAAVGGGLWWYLSSGPGAFTTVPSVVGKDSATAKDLLEQAGLAVDPTEAYDHSIAADQIISSEPEPGSRIRKDGTVTIVVSLGQDLVTVPDGIVGATGAEAEAALTAADLVAVYAPGQNSDTVPTGSVISADYAAGDSIERRGKVTLTLSQGPAAVSIPNVAGSTPEAAEATLTNAGLKYARGEDAFSDTVPANQVISQSPTAGTGGHRMDTVTVVVSKGPELFPIPDVTNRMHPYAAGAAKEVITAAGFTVEVVRSSILGTGFSADTLPVISQSPAAGTMHPKGTLVTLTTY